MLTLVRGFPCLVFINLSYVVNGFQRQCNHNFPTVGLYTRVRAILKQRMKTKTQQAFPYRWIVYASKGDIETTDEDKDTTGYLLQNKLRILQLICRLLSSRSSVHQGAKIMCIDLICKPVSDLMSIS
jgi:hypothetical protein